MIQRVSCLARAITRAAVRRLVPDPPPRSHPFISSASKTAMDDFPPYHFKCPISMELMKDHVTISTGVTYERNNIEKWFFSYKKKTCHAAM
ncbi:hypothetical protein ACFX13_042966 [Malus domestica]